MILQLLAIVDVSPLPNIRANENSVETIMQFVFGVAAAICVLIIAIAGFKYTMSMGEADATKKAKDTILNAFIGLIVVIFANAIVGFVIKQL